MKGDDDEEGRDGEEHSIRKQFEEVIEVEEEDGIESSHDDSNAEDDIPLAARLLATPPRDPPGPCMKQRTVGEAQARPRTRVRFNVAKGYCRTTKRKPEEWNLCSNCPLRFGHAGLCCVDPPTKRGRGDVKGSPLSPRHIWSIGYPISMWERAP